jgi:secreted PhoX family phosphatase
MYVAMTSEDLVVRVELNGEDAFVSNYVKEGVNATGLDSPDNLALDPFGNLYIAEDRSQSDIFVAHAGSGGQLVAGSVERFASLSDCDAESTGIYFDRDGKTLFVQIQHAGGPAQNDLTMAIQRAR